MAFAEALSDDGSMTGRGRPVLRGAVTGLMTAAGGIGHTLPFLMKDFPCGVYRGGDCGGGGAGHDCVDSELVYGYSAALGGVSGGGGRSVGICGWDLDLAALEEFVVGNLNEQKSKEKLCVLASLLVIYI